MKLRPFRWDEFWFSTAVVLVLCAVVIAVRCNCGTL